MVVQSGSPHPRPPSRRPSHNGRAHSGTGLDTGLMLVDERHVDRRLTCAFTGGVATKTRLTMRAAPKPSGASTCLTCRLTRSRTGCVKPRTCLRRRHRRSAQLVWRGSPSHTRFSVRGRALIGATASRTAVGDAVVPISPAIARYHKVHDSETSIAADRRAAPG